MVWTDNHNYIMCHICENGILDFDFNEAAIDKISNFQKIDPNFTCSPKS